MDVSAYCSLYTGGKEAMAGEIGKFNQAASLAYNAPDAKNKEQLLCASKSIEKRRQMSLAEVKKEGAKTFKKIRQHAWNIEHN